MKKPKCLRCGECCFAFEVPEIQKPSFQKCPYYKITRGKGTCSIYRNRPYSCRIFVLPDVNGNCALGAIIKERKEEDENDL